MNKITDDFCIECDASCRGDSLFLQSLSDDERHRLMKNSVRRTLEKGSILFHEGDPVDAIYIIRNGRIKLTCYDAEGRERIIGFFSRNETIWEGLMMEESRFPYSAECLTTTQICILYREDLMKTLRDAQVAMSIISLLSRKLHDANERNLVLSTKDPKARLAAFFLYRGKRDQSGHISLTLDDISVALSMRPETVSRKITELTRDGLIERGGKSSIRILNFEGLEALANA